MLLKFLVFNFILVMKIAIITSGGDAPGMNACVRAVVRTAINNEIEVCGYYRGYEGIIDNDFTELKVSSVGQIIQRGGTILKTARSERFFSKENRQLAAQNLKDNSIDALVVIGGDGSFTGARIFSEEHHIPVVGVPGTIDNDLYGTDFTIGYDTAINTVVAAVDKIRDTAMSHDRVFVVEVMGRDAGFIALRSGIAVGAEAILIPETKTYIERLLKRLENRRGSKSSAIVIVAEGDDFGGADKVAQAIQEKYASFDVKVTRLGHIQRGGNPSAMDRVLASFLGAGAVQALIDGKSGVMIGMRDKKVVHVSFEKAIKHHQDIDDNLLELAEMLSV
jgi:6-phosphofructokinase 1